MNKGLKEFEVKNILKHAAEMKTFTTMWGGVCYEFLTPKGEINITPLFAENDRFSIRLSGKEVYIGDRSENTVLFDFLEEKFKTRHEKEIKLFKELISGDACE